MPPGRSPSNAVDSHNYDDRQLPRERDSSGMRPPRPEEHRCCDDSLRMVLPKLRPKGSVRAPYNQ